MFRGDAEPENRRNKNKLHIETDSFSNGVRADGISDNMGDSQRPCYDEVRRAGSSS